VYSSSVSNQPKGPSSLASEFEATYHSTCKSYLSFLGMKQTVMCAGSIMAHMKKRTDSSTPVSDQMRHTLSLLEVRRILRWPPLAVIDRNDGLRQEKFKMARGWYRYTNWYTAGALLLAKSSASGLYQTLSSRSF